MATFTKTALVVLALTGTALSGAFAQQADQATPNQSQQVTPQAPAAAPVRSRVASRQILLEPTAAPVKVAAADAAPVQAAATPAQAAPAPAAAAPAVVAPVAVAPAAVAPQVAVQA